MPGQLDQRQKNVVFILVVAVLGVITVFSFYSRQKEYSLRIQKDQELSARLSELAQKDEEIIKLTRQKIDLEDQMNAKIEAMEATLKNYEENTKTLYGKLEKLNLAKADLEIESAGREKTISDLTKKIHELEMDKLDLLNAIKELQGGLEEAAAEEKPSENKAAPAGTSAEVLVADAAETDTVRLGKIVVKKSSGYPARVEHVNKIHGFIVVNVGTKDGLQKDAMINVLRNGRLVGKAVIEKPRANISAAVILPEWTKEDIQVGDTISRF